MGKLFLCKLQLFQGKMLAQSLILSKKCLPALILSWINSTHHPFSQSKHLYGLVFHIIQGENMWDWLYTFFSVAFYWTFIVLCWHWLMWVNPVSQDAWTKLSVDLWFENRTQCVLGNCAASTSWSPSQVAIWMPLLSHLSLSKRNSCNLTNVAHRETHEGCE